jgi:RNA polymerase primary sigma factor
MRDRAQPVSSPLPVARERRLLVLTGAGDRVATEELVTAFMPAIDGVAGLYRSFRSLERQELQQEGVVGLLRAARRYDQRYETPFWAYASWWVRQAMQQLVAELTRPVVLSDRAARQLARVKDARREHLQARGKEPSLRELADETDLPRRQVERLVLAERSARALDEPITGDEGVVGTFGDLLADPQAEAAFERVPHRLEVERTLRLLEGLSERERTILHGRFGLDCAELTLRELAERLGVSAERVRQLEERALSRLRDAVDSEPDRPRYDPE